MTPLGCEGPSRNQNLTIERAAGSDSPGSAGCSCLPGSSVVSAMVEGPGEGAPISMSDNKPTKPMPSAAEINAYLEQSAARTRKRLPLAKNPVAKDPVAKDASRALPLQESKKLPTSTEGPAAEPASPSAESGWRPFSRDDE